MFFPAAQTRSFLICAWGLRQTYCTRTGRRTLGCTEQVFLATPAGMNRSAGRFSALPNKFPCACGDEPLSAVEQFPEALVSPRVRG